MRHQSLRMNPPILDHRQHSLDSHPAAGRQLRMNGLSRHAPAAGEFWKWKIAGSAKIIHIGHGSDSITHHINGLGEHLIIAAADDHTIGTQSASPRHHLLHHNGKSCSIYSSL